MTKLYRRTWERQRYGRAGAISSVLSARVGIDGVIASATFAAPVKVLTSATAAFVSTDIGRKIRLGSTPSNRYDGHYVIDSVNSGTSVNLRCNHNVNGTPTSDAKFYENGTNITWKICESCTFTADASGDIEDFTPGSYMYIESGNSGNKGLWLISHRTSSQVVVLSKSYVWFAVDNNPFTPYVIDATQDFLAESTLHWYIIDRQAICAPDYYELQLQFMIDAGWTMLQQRGPNTTLQTYRDVVLKTTGETDALIPGGKAMYLRWCINAIRTSASVFNGNGMGMNAAVFQHWDPTLTATVPGNGSGGCRASSGNDNATANPANNFSSAQSQWSNTYLKSSVTTSAQSYVERGRSDLPDAQTFFDYSLFGDRDELQAYNYLLNVSSTIQWGRFMVSHLKPMGANPNIITVSNAVTAGSLKDLNVGSVDMTALTPPYAVGDNITLIGRKTSTNAEYVETTTIVSFDNTVPTARLVRVAAINMAFGNGPDTLKLQIGEDPFPVAISMSVNATLPVPYLQNASKLANAATLLGSPGRDYDAGVFGSAAVCFQTWGPTFTEIDPNRKTGKFGLTSVGVKNNTNGEFRGRWRYYWNGPDYKYPMGSKILVNGVDVYVSWGPDQSGVCHMAGPIPKALAGVYP